MQHRKTPCPCGGEIIDVTEGICEERDVHVEKCNECKCLLYVSVK